MIRSAITPRRFAWSGGLALLCLTVILLPASRGQDKADDKKAEEKKEIRLKVDLKKAEDDAARTQEELQRKLAALQAELQAKKAEAEKLAEAMRKLQADAERKARAEEAAKAEALMQRERAEAEAQRALAVQAALQAEMAAKTQAAQKDREAALAARYTALQKEGQAPKEDDKDPRAKEIKDLQTKLEALIRERDRLAKAAPPPVTGTVAAKKILMQSSVDEKTGKQQTAHIIMLEKDGKGILELPSEVIVAERNGKLIIEIPLAVVEGRKPLTPPAVVPPPAGAKGTPPAATATFILKDDGTVFSGEGLKGWNVQHDPKVQGQFKIVAPAAPPASAEDRLGNLEKKLAEVLKELEGLRKEMKAKDGKGKTGTATISADGLFLKMDLDSFVVPLPPKPGEAPKAPVPPTPVKP